MLGAMIYFSDVSKRYPQGDVALSDVSFHLAEGEMAFLTGHSGAGKSTVLKLLLLMEYCSRGQLFINGRNVNRLSRREVPYLRRIIGMINQSPQLLGDRSVFDNVAMPLFIGGFTRKEIRKRVCSALDKVGLLSKQKAFPGALSMGEQQRVGIARAVVNQPVILLADEPTGNLDPELSLEIMHLFEQFNHIGVTVLVATHDVTIIEQLSRRTLVLSHGRLVEDQRWEADVD